jgi:hypothetical protein
MILNIFYGEQLVNSSGMTSFFDSIFSSVFFYFLIILGIFLIFFLYLFLIKPILFKKNPDKIFKRYLLLREDMQRIDELFIRKQINFEDYVFAQFNNAKEYEQIIFVLSKFPEYKSKVKSYTIAYSKEQEQEEKKYSEEDRLFLKNVNWLYETLYPHTKYYTKDEIRQGILDEGYDVKIANTVLSKFEKDQVSFSTEIYYPQKKAATFINKLFGYHEHPIQIKPDQENVPNKYDSEERIDLSRFGQKQKNVFDEERLDIKKVKFVEEKEKERRLNLLSKIFQKKKTTPTVNQINNIFKDIQKHINK